MELTALLSIIHHTKPKMDGDIYGKIAADVSKDGITAEGARQHVKKMLRSFAPNVDNVAPVTPKRKTTSLSANDPPKKRAKRSAPANDESNDDVHHSAEEEEESIKPKAKAKAVDKKEPDEEEV